MMKKWCTRGTGYAGEDNWFETRTKAREHARKVLLSGTKKVVRIGKLNEEKYLSKTGSFRTAFETVEVWGWEAPRRVGKVKVTMR